MPARLLLSLQGPPPARPIDVAEYRHANGLRAWVYDSLARVDPAFAADMHADTWPKPLTISPLWWGEAGWTVEIVVLLDGLARLLLEGVQARGAGLRLGRDAFAVAAVRLAEYIDLDVLDTLATPARQLLVDFRTPTSHHDTLIVDTERDMKVKVGHPLPDPARTVTSWWHKWNCLMGRLGRPAMPPTLRDGLPHLALARMRGETAEVRLGARQRLVGFVGAAVFEVPAPAAAPPDFALHLARLAAFANYCGTGVETLRGMGQTRVTLRPERPIAS